MNSKKKHHENKLTQTAYRLNVLQSIFIRQTENFNEILYDTDMSRDSTLN